MEEIFRTPTDLERAFLRVITRCHPELARQIESCELTDYDPTGCTEVRVLAGPPCPSELKEPIDGPSLSPADGRHPPIDILLWLNDERMLCTIEVVVYGDLLPHVYQRFVDANGTPELKYYSKITQG